MAEDATAEDAMAEDATAEDATAEDAMAEDATVKNTTAELSKKRGGPYDCGGDTQGSLCNNASKLLV